MLRDYCLKQHSAIRGWLQGGALSVLWSILELQEQAGIHGHLAEIGVYHGRLFAMLALATRSDERASAIDPFTMPSVPHFRDRFESNLHTAGVDMTRVDVHERMSESIPIGSAAHFLGSQCRLISIDGAHTKENVLHDLALADECLSDRGVVAVDDFFNPWCADVTEGVYEYLNGGHRDLCAVALADSVGPRNTGAPKLFLVRAGQHRFYREALNGMNGHNLKVRVPICGSPTMIFDFSQGVRKKILYRKDVAPQTP